MCGVVLVCVFSIFLLRVILTRFEEPHGPLPAVQCIVTGHLSVIDIAHMWVVHCVCTSAQSGGGMTASFVNAVQIIVLNYLYKFVAVRLNDLGG